MTQPGFFILSRETFAKLWLFKKALRKGVYKVFQKMFGKNRLATCKVSFNYFLGLEIDF